MSKRSINQDTKETTGGFVDIAGINDNWMLDSYKFAPLKDGGSPILQFIFKNGAINVRLTEWDIDEAKEKERNQNNKNSKITDDEAVTKAYNAQNGRITQILRCFLNKEEVVINADTYADYSNAVIALLDKAKDKTQLLRMKTIYGSDGKYLEFSTRNGRFINLAKDPIGDMKITDWEKDRMKKENPTSEGELAGNTANPVKKGEF